MKCNVNIRLNADVELKPGDTVTVLSGYRKGRKLEIKKMIETKYGVNAVFTNGTWRPLRTYGTTWQ